MENSASQRKIRSFKTFRCLKIKFEGNKTTQGNTHIIDSFKTFLGFKICDAGDFQEVIFTHFIHDVTIRTKFWRLWLFNLFTNISHNKLRDLINVCFCGGEKRFIALKNLVQHGLTLKKIKITFDKASLKLGIRHFLLDNYNFFYY